MTDAPKRMFTLSLSWGADSRDDLAHALRHIAFEIQSGRSSGRVTSGSPSDGGHYELDENPGMTNERYFAEVATWLAREGDPSPCPHPDVADAGPDGAR